MTFQRQVARTLDDEHRTNLDLLGRVEQGFARAPRSDAARRSEVAKLAGLLGRHIEQDIERHFAFEERELFPRLAERGAPLPDNGPLPQLLPAPVDPVAGHPGDRSVR